MTATVLCVFFMLAEIVGGVLSNSLAIATDAAHMLTDFASFLISLLAIWLASRPKSQKMSFGWHRAEVIGATISVLMIWLVTGVIVYMAILRYVCKPFGDKMLTSRWLIINCVSPVSKPEILHQNLTH